MNGRSAFVASLLLLACVSFLWAEPPRLVVHVSVDQWCEDYLIRFRDNFAETGLIRRVERSGARYTNCHHRHAYTVTAPGHAVQLTGADPAVHGIVGNEWYEPATNKTRYCVSDPSVSIIGIADGSPMSPRNLMVETVGDQLKGTSPNSKVMGVSIKDRAAILMTGHRADAAYWLEKNKWVTSTYYRNELPGYLRVLNEQNAIEQYRGAEWKLLLHADRYHNGPDDVAFENPPTGFSTTFPHALAKAGELDPGKFGDQVLFSQFGNEYTLLAAREIVRGEKLGDDAAPDLLAINLASTDYVGHAFGPQSLEVEDMAYRTDEQLGEFARWLDEQIGEGRWILTLTADHAVAPIPELAAQSKLPAKRDPIGTTATMTKNLEAHLRSALSIPNSEATLVLNIDAHQVYLRKDHPRLVGDNWTRAQRLARDWFLSQPYVAAARTREDMLRAEGSELDVAMRRSFNPLRSGDLFFALAPYCIMGGAGKGTTHGSPWRYDTHVPLLLLGPSIKPGVYHRRVSPPCLASTLAEIFEVDLPSANCESPLHEALGR